MGKQSRNFSVNASFGIYIFESFKYGYDLSYFSDTLGDPQSRDPNHRLNRYTRKETGVCNFGGNFSVLWYIQS